MTVRISELPTGVTTRPATVPGNQQGATRQLTFPPAAFHESATNAEARDGTSTTRQMTPATTTAVVTPLERQLNNFFVGWTTTVTNSTTTKGSALAGVTQIITQDARTVALTPLQIGLVYDTAVGVPGIAGDTLRIGMVVTNTDNQRILLAYYNIVGERAFILNSQNSWDSLANTDDTPYLHDAHGIETGSGWFLIHHGAKHAPSTTPQRLWVVRRVAARLEALAPSYTAQVGEPGDTDYAAATFVLFSTNNEFSSGAADLTGTDVRDALETLSGADRTPLTIIKRDTATYGDVPTIGRGDAVDWTHPLKWESIYEPASPQGVSAKNVWEDVALTAGRNILDYGEFIIAYETGSDVSSRGVNRIAIPFTSQATLPRRLEERPDFGDLTDFAVRGQQVTLTSNNIDGQRALLLRVKDANTLQLRLTVADSVSDANETYSLANWRMRGVWGRRTASLHPIVSTTPLAMSGNFTFTRDTGWVRNTNIVGTFSTNDIQELTLPNSERFDNYTRLYCEVTFTRLQPSGANDTTYTSDSPTIRTSSTTPARYIYEPPGGVLVEQATSFTGNSLSNTGVRVSIASNTSVSVALLSWRTTDRFGNLNPAMNQALTGTAITKLYGIKDNLVAD